MAACATEGPAGAASPATLPVMARNVLGTELQLCGVDPLIGFFRDGVCHTGPQDLGSHTICAVVTGTSSRTSDRSATIR